MLQIEIAYAKSPTEQMLLSITVNPHSTIRGAIEKSGILQRYPELILSDLVLGIFGEKKDLADALQDQDRIEIYRPLIVDPMEARRRRVMR